MKRVLGAALVAVLTVGLPGTASAATGDTTPPVVEDVGIAPGTRVNGTVKLQPVVSDDVAVTRVALVVNHEWVTAVDAEPWTLTWRSASTPFLREQEATVEVRAYDAAGNRASAQVRVYVDNYGPFVSFPWGVGRASHGPSSHFTGVVPLDFRARGLPPDTAGIEVTAGSAVLGRVEAEPWTIDWDTREYDGEVTLVARAWDTSGNVRLSNTTVWADHAGPTIGIDFDIADGYVSGRNGAVYVTADDPAHVRLIELLADGKLIGTTDQGGAWLPWDRTARNGRSTMTVRAYDGIGNRSELIRTVVVDNDPPVVTAATPGNGAHVRRTFSATVTRASDPAGFAYVSAKLDDHFSEVAYRYPWTVRLDTTNLRDGRHTLTWEVRDGASNATYVRRSVVVDNTSPRVGWGKVPTTRKRLRGSTTFTASARDTWGLKWVELLVNGKVVAVDKTAGYKFKINPKRYGKKFTVRLRAYDLAGNVAYSSKRTYRR